MRLTAREKSELFGEGIVTVILLLLLNLSIYVLLDQMIKSNPALADGIFQIKMSLSFGPGPYHVRFWSWGGLFVTIMLVADVFIVYWRLIRRYRQMQLHHIISELHYIAEGHFDHRISFQLQGDMQRIAQSINALVDSTIKSMEEERQIERSKDELITNVSHDIRTPLTSIIGYLGLIEDKQYHSKEDIFKYTHTAYLKAKEMKALVEDLFEYTKVRQTDTPLNMTQIDLGQMIEQIAASFELEASKKEMKITTELETKHIMMEADAEKLARVFNNLLSNALKYGNGGRHIFLKVSYAGAHEIIVEVANDGPMIPAKALEQLFDRFYRVESSRSKETGGSGLGLAIAQSIIDLHNGYIYALSDQKLTSFIIHLPVKQIYKIEKNKELKN
ncbi:sensor histidine kinase [Liquorilactobacillus capillatus]|uniref:histidine kinase n=1 Tax=Liquorilactobacillus capillatus DSM 19910 TaxID=1423731 RepID=A0A0R1MBY3_9LACO|nr:HAMP domain-containing sensor histidine kinase [Liquorilactobacillus capillatus]KRL00888.1 two component system histidine kinase [Liquorilactobacillus capillatus DSM 19910]